MTLPWPKVLRRTARWLRNAFRGRAVILLYHRVVEVPTDPALLCVTPRRFAEHMEILRKTYRPMTLAQLVQAVQHGKVPRRAVVVTFDDGYADNLHNAKPVLVRHGVPATVFVTAGHLGQDREFWWDELERLLLLPRPLPERGRLQFDGEICTWELGDASAYGDDAFARNRGWHVLEPQEPTARHTLYRTLHRRIRPLSSSRRQQALQELVAWARAEPTGRPSHRALLPAELLQLAEGGLVEIGAHTVTHPVLSATPASEQRTEIQQSKARLEALLGRPVTAFAYPYGACCDYTDETVALVREAGFTSACSNFPGLVKPGTDGLQLPRAMTFNWEGEEFARRLHGFFDA